MIVSIVKYSTLFTFPSWNLESLSINLHTCFIIDIKHDCILLKINPSPNIYSCRIKTGTVTKLIKPYMCNTTVQHIEDLIHMLISNWFIDVKHYTEYNYSSTLSGYKSNLHLALSTSKSSNHLPGFHPHLRVYWN